MSGAFARLGAGLFAASVSLGSSAACSPEKGIRIFETKCAMCHSLGKDQGHLMGPNLAGIVGRPVGKAPGFQYSQAMAGAGGEWDEKMLDLFLTSPSAAFPGTAMPFGGIKNGVDRASTICHLKGVENAK